MPGRKSNIGAGRSTLDDLGFGTQPQCDQANRDGGADGVGVRILVADGGDATRRPKRICDLSEAAPASVERGRQRVSSDG